MSEIRSTIILLMKHKAHDALNDYIREHEPLDYESIKGLNLPMVRSISSRTVMRSIDLYNYPNLLDVNHSSVEVEGNFYKNAKLITKCFRGHFLFTSYEILYKYLSFWLCVIPDRKITRYKYDWVLASPELIVHLRGRYFWISNPTILPYCIEHKLNKLYVQIYAKVNSELIKLDESAVEFLKDVCGTDLKTLEYGVMDRSLFDTIVSEHIRVHTSESPSIRRWASHYNVRLGMSSSPSIILNYISTTSPESVWSSPIYLGDLSEERRYIMRMLESNESKHKYQTSL